MTQPAETTTTAAEPTALQTLEAAAAEVWGAPEASEAKTETEAKVEEPKVEPKAEEPAAKTASGRIAAAKRAEQRAESQRVELRQQKETQAKREAELATREAELKLLEEDPSKYFEIKKLGVKGIQAHLEKLAGTSKPEAVAERQLTAVEEKIAKLEAELKRRDEEAERTQMQQRHSVAERQAAAAFIEHVGSAADKYPNLTSEYGEQEAVNVAFAELTRVVGHDRQGRPINMAQAYIAKHGVEPDHDVIAEHLEAIAKARIDARANRGWRKGTTPATQASEASPTGEASKVPPVKGTSPRTLSRADTSQRAAPPRMRTQEEIDEECIRILEAGNRKSG